MTTREKWLLASLGVLAVLAALARTDKGAVAVASVADAIGAATRGLRNNNPGNVRLTSPATQWVGWVGPAEQTDPSYVQMRTMSAGVRMALVVFRNYQTKYGLKSIAELVARWAPPAENDTAAYAANVAARVGVGAGIPIDLRNRDTAFDFLRGVFRQENGVAAELVPASTIYEGIEAAA